MNQNRPLSYRVEFGRHHSPHASASRVRTCFSMRQQLPLHSYHCGPSHLSSTDVRAYERCPVTSFTYKGMRGGEYYG
jgi:hypothetical protein